MGIKVVDLRPAEKADNVLKKAIGEFDSVVLIGYDKEGVLDARASLNIDAANINFMVDLFKTKLLNGDYQDDG